jgi:hypothetical protein
MTGGPRSAPAGQALLAVLAVALLASCESSAGLEEGESAEYLALATCHHTGDYAFGSGSIYQAAVNTAMKDCEAKVQSPWSRAARDVNPFGEIEHCCRIDEKVANERGWGCIAVAAASRLGIASYIETTGGKGRTEEEARDDALEHCDRRTSGCRVLESRCRTLPEGGSR